MCELTREFVKFFVSLKLTVVLLGLSALLVLFATLDQVHLGIWAVQEKWFKSWMVIETLGTDMTLLWYAGYFGGLLLFLGLVRWIGGKSESIRHFLSPVFFVSYAVLVTAVAGLHAVTDRPVPVPRFPGGYFIGGLLLINLIAAHLKRFAFTWKKAGIQLVHAGLILLLLGELFTGLFQEEYQLKLNEGETRNYSESWRYNELAVTEIVKPDEELVTAIPEGHLKHGHEIQASALPFTIVPRGYYPNASLMMKEQLPAGQASVENLATAGLGPRFALTPMKVTYDPNQKNWPAAFVEIMTSEGSLGTRLVSTMLLEPESFQYAGRTWNLSLRPVRAYKPYSLTLLKLTHDIYPGSDIPKNFSSRVKLNTPDGREDREVLIYMNNPLRYGGLTFYQYQMDAANSYTVLQVVRNPSWLIPYVSCLLMALGLLWQFGSHLLGFNRKRAATEVGS